MNLLEFFNEAQEVELKNPRVLQKVLDEFLSFTAQSDQLPPELEAAEARLAVLRSRLEQSNLPGLSKHGKTAGKYGKLSLDAEDARAINLAVRTMATSQDAANLGDDMSAMPTEGLSVNGAEGLGGHGDGFEIQNQGVTRRRPGEGPKANGGRSQSQTMDSYDQPQYEANDIGSAVQGFLSGDEQDEFIDQLGGLEDVPPPHPAGVERYGPTGAPPVLQPSVKGVFDPDRTSGTSGYDFTQDNDAIAQGVATANQKFGIKDEEFMGVRDPESFEKQDNRVGSQEVGSGMNEAKGVLIAARDHGANLHQILRFLDPTETTLMNKLRQAARTPALIKIEDDELGPFKEMLHKFLDVFGRRSSAEVELAQDMFQQMSNRGQGMQEAAEDNSLQWRETYRGRQYEAETDIGKFLVHKHISGDKWIHVFQPAEGIEPKPAYRDGYEPTAERAKARCQSEFENLMQHRRSTDAASGALAQASMGSMFQGRKPLMNSRDKAQELKKSSEKEQGEHPWASKKIATRIARDHMKEEGVMRLTEFYAINEGKGSFFTLEPEVNGMGRLLSWEEDDYADNGDSWFEPVATGNLDELLAALYKEAPRAKQVEDQIRQSFEQAVSDGGEAVYFNPYDMTVDIMLKADKSSEKTDPGSYEHDNPNRYF